jgi:hypothetical protein
MTAYMGEPNATLLQNIAIFENAGAPIPLKFAVFGLFRRVQRLRM